MADLVPEGRYLPMFLPELGITAHWVMSPEGSPYLAVRATCADLGVLPDRQLQKLQADDTYNDPECLREFRIETAGGRQVTKCLRKAEAALWIATINARKVRPELRGRMADIRASILHAADRIVFGDMTGVVAISNTPARGGDLHLGSCPKCRAQLGAHVAGDGITLYLLESE